MSDLTDAELDREPTRMILAIWESMRPNPAKSRRHRTEMPAPCGTCGGARVWYQPPRGRRYATCASCNREAQRRHYRRKRGAA